MSQDLARTTPPVEAAPAPAQRQVQSQGKAGDRPAPERSTRPAAQKAAAILALLDDETLQKLAGRFPDRHRDKLLAAARSLRGVDRREQKRIAHEFAGELTALRGALKGGDDTAQRLEGALFLPPPEPEMEFEPTPMALAPPSLWDRVAEVPTQKLIGFLSSMPPAVVSLILGRLPEKVVGELINEVEDGVVADSVVHMAANPKGHPIAVEAVEHLVETRLLAVAEDDEADAASSGPAPTDGAHADRVAGLLNRMVSRRRDTILTRLGNEVEEATVTEIMSRVLTFSSLEDRLPRNAIPTLLREIDEKTLLRALKSAQVNATPVVEYLLANISQRLAVQYREKLDALEPLDEDAGEKAQSAFICELLALAEDGRITLLSKEDG